MDTNRINQTELNDFHNLLRSVKKTDRFGGIYYKFKNTNLRSKNLADLEFPKDSIFTYSDFTGANLRGAVFHGGEISYTNFSNAKLFRTDFSRVEMNNVNLHETDLRNTILPELIQSSNLTSVNLNNKNLEGYDFFGVNFESANLSGANLTEATFYGEDTDDVLQISNLTGANLENANLQRAVLSNCNLYAAVLKNANLTGAILWGANLQNADLRGANLSRADLRNADLRGADLTGVNLENTYMFGTNIQNILYNGNVTFDEYMAAVANLNPPRDFLNIPPVPAGNAYEVHRASHALLNNGKFLDIIGAGEMLGPEEFDYDEEYDIMKNFIKKNSTLFDDTEDLLAKIDMIWDKVRDSVPSKQESYVMWKASNFAYKQDNQFTAAYISTFIDEAAGAYVCDDPNLRLSCTQGIRERIYTSLLGGASLVRTIEGFEPTREIVSLSCISKIGNIQKNPNEAIQRWSLQIDNDTWKSSTKKQRIEDFKNFMREDYKYDECYEINRKAIEEIINNKATEIDYVFDNNDEVTFGGKKLKKKNKKTRKRRKSKTKKKSKIKKNKKSKKKNLITL